MAVQQHGAVRALRGPYWRRRARFRLPPAARPDVQGSSSVTCNVNSPAWTSRYDGGD